MRIGALPLDPLLKTLYLNGKQDGVLPCRLSMTIRSILTSIPIKSLSKW